MQLAFLPRDASPIRRQYLALKQQHPDAILFFQLGDFYETFEEDAKTVAEVCDVALTSREMGRGERVPMAGVPVHAAETYIARLVERGHHVALCQQTEAASAASARGASSIVRREVIRVITPGTVVDPALLPATRTNLLAAVVTEGSRAGIAYVDINVGSFFCTECPGVEGTRAELWRTEPAECLVEEGAALPGLPESCSLTVDSGLFLDHERTLYAHFQVASVAALGLGAHPLAARAAAAIIRYATRTNPQAMALLQQVSLYDPLGHMILDPTTRDHLELIRSVRGRRDSSLLGTLDATGSPMGSRLLATWLGRPLVDPEAIAERLDAVEALFRSDALRAELRSQLSALPDLERLAGRAAQRLLSPREALSLAQGIAGSESISQTLQGVGQSALSGVEEQLAVPGALAEEIRATVADDPPLTFGEGVIRSGRFSELDELKHQSSNGRQWLLDLERRERDRTGLRNLKVGYNRVFGYYLEVSTAALSQPLDYYRQQETGASTVESLLEQLGYQRRQTVANAERFVLSELREFESRQARASARMGELEREAYEALVERIAAHTDTLLRAAGALAKLDVLSTFAEVSRERHYVRPLILAEPITEIVGGRHPVVERSVGWSAYIPNDARLSGPDCAPEAPSLVMLTGPNMAGKTTYGRMILLVCLMAQVGCFVPAERARLGIADRLFLRSGASDDIAGGQSTFMVEMTEAAAILRSATPRSLAFFDEVGRGTSTYDGMAIARAVAEFLAMSPVHACRTVFSTHYHELAAIESELPGVCNYCMEVREAADGVIFTYRVVPGSADRSYGVHVARLAGLPPTVVARAEAVLADLEQGNIPGRMRADHSDNTTARSEAFAEELSLADVDQMTPVEALNVLARLRAAALAYFSASNKAAEDS
ncbi:MAG: DNA mismatch repair protein MutS [Chloroflexi bacterium]|nr:DNA mismatch repair protein MutS [Chloroflexota bacterium]